MSLNDLKNSSEEPIGIRLKRLAKTNPTKYKQIMEALTPEEAQEIWYDPDLWLRPKQRINDDWPEPIIMMMLGRGAGKTFSGVSWIRKKVNQGVKSITIVAPTSSDLRNTIVYEGILHYSHPNEAPEYEPSKSRVVWPNGAVAKLISAEKGEERVRGSNNELVWVDELGSIQDKEVLDQLLLTLRVGESRCLITTTPRPNEAIIDLYKRAVFNEDESKWYWCEREEKWKLEKDVRIITGSTYENFDNLSESFKSTIIAAYEGTRLEQQEIQGKLLLTNENALWTPDVIAEQTLKPHDTLPEMEVVAIGVDPAVTNNKKSDDTGIIVAGLGADGHGYVLDDKTGKYSTQGWVTEVLQLYDHYREGGRAVSIVVESNMGGNMVQDALHRERPFLPVDSVFATTSKLNRASPVALLYEKGMVWHVRGLGALETELTTYDGTGKKSPNRLDAAVYAIMQIMPTKKSVTKSFEMLF